ncbi:hypothetical protein O181_034702 [Austropuccinia psidii MF-1]|uniref:methylated diphthine methylhydrolase n=1 Tax=Austropuccinia psidii MF-1 TaxID=1389203 RepID=A0A9Q3D755_9BASI|nr:hypothetical protein [Austropuccinia psidii MF-1]
MIAIKIFSECDGEDIQRPGRQTGDMEPALAHPACIINTVYTPCSVEFCPVRPNLVTCGLYQTQQVQQDAGDESQDPPIERLGRCLLFDVTTDRQGSDRSSDPLVDAPIVCQELQQIDCAAILDQRWTQSLAPVLIVADADGDLRSYQLRQEDERTQLHFFDTVSCASNGALCLALDISDRLHSTQSPKVVTTLSNGEIVLLDQTSSSKKLVENIRWHGHTFEPWTCGFDYWQPTTVLTGGDDCTLKVWDVRSLPGQPVLINKKFGGGVTAVRSHHLKEHVFAVGSYDSALRVYDKRNFSQPVWTQTVGGGIWRLKWHSDQPDRLLIAAMHDGFKVVEVFNESSDTPPRIHTTFNERASLAYGADWGPALTQEDLKQTLVASCSFYDKALHFWYVS